MLRRIVGLDPGGTTGWAVLTINEDGKRFWKCGQFEAKNHHLQLDAFLRQHLTDVFEIVCESFEYRNMSRPGLVLDSVEYIGVMKLFCQENYVHYTMQTASMGKVRDKPTAFVKPSNIKKLGLWSPGQGHAMDAIGHILYYMINNIGLDKEELLKAGWK